MLRIELHQDGKRGVVLIATNSDMLTLIDAFRTRTRYNVGQLLGRMCNQVMQLYPDELPIEDVRLICERFGKFRATTIRKLHDLATREHLGHLGLLQDIMDRAWSDARLDGAELTDELVIQIADETLADIARRPNLYKAH
jgi:hypothetical protein